MRDDGRSGSTASVERSRHVGFTPDSGRMAATQLNDASGQKATYAPQQDLAHFERLILQFGVKVDFASVALQALQ
jgi:hypothetical protein